MAVAVCTVCGRDVRWSGGRGQRLADLRCRCGGVLRGKTAGRPGLSGGYESCAVCGQRRRSTGRHLKTLRAAGTYQASAAKIGQDEGAVRLEPGARVCWYHESNETWLARCAEAEREREAYAAECAAPTGEP